MSDIAKNKGIQELIFRVRKGDDEAFSELLSMYTPLIESSLLRSLGDELYALYSEDLRQEATMVFYNSILTYDVEQYEVEFGLYAKICISNALVSQIRLYKQKTAEPLDENAENSCNMGAGQDPAERILEEERVTALYALVRNNLSPYEYKVWSLYVSGKTAKDIGKIVGVDEKSVNNAIYRIRKKLRERLE